MCKSDPNPIRSDFGTKIFISDRIGLIKLFRSRIGSDRTSMSEINSSRSGDIFFNEIYKSSKQINSQKTSQSILFMCRAKFGTNQLKSMKSRLCFLRYTDISGDSISSSLHPGSHEIASTHAPSVRHKNAVRKKLFFMLISFFGFFLSF